MPEVAPDPQDTLNSGQFHFPAWTMIVGKRAMAIEQPPFHADFPFAPVDGKLQPHEPAFSQWEARLPVHMVKRYRANLQKLRGLRFDSGWDDEFSHIVLASRQLSRTLTSQGIDHIFEEYNGDHRNRIRGRTGRLYTAVLPYFWLLLDADNPK